MPRAFLVVMDSVGCGGAPDAGRFFNDGHPDTGANTLGHIAAACAAGQAEEGRSGPLRMPNLCALGLGQAVRIAYLHLTVWCGIQDFYFEEIRVFQAGTRLEYISME